MSMKIVSFGDVRIAAESFGDPTDPPVLLIMGAMASMLWWPDDFCRDLAARGRYVVRYDNRDTGLSSRSQPGNPDYTFEDMAADAVRVLDAYGIDRAHLVGMSLGGMIGQIAVLARPERFLTFTAISTSPMGIDTSALPGMSAAYLDHAATGESVDWSNAGQAIDFLRREMKVIASTRHPHDAQAAHAFLERDAARSGGFASATNHFMLKGGETLPGPLECMATPLLVIHGSADPVFPEAHGQMLAGAVPGARFVSVAGGGHEVHPGDFSLFLGEIERHTLRPY